MRKLLGWTMVALCALPIPGVAQGVDVVGTVTSFRAARHSARPTAGGAYSAITANQPVRNGDGLRTERRGHAQIKFRDDSVLRLKELTELIVQDSVTLRRLQLSRGALWVRVTKGSNTSVQTPVATATVRGTEFLMDAEGNLAVREGIVELEANGFTIEVLAGEIAGVDKDGRPFKKGVRIPTEPELQLVDVVIPISWWELMRYDPSIPTASPGRDRTLESAALFGLPLLLLIDFGGKSSEPDPVPEPASLAGLAAGAVALAAAKRRRNR